MRCLAALLQSGQRASRVAASGGSREDSHGLASAHDQRSDAVLLARLAANDASALDALLARYWSPLTMFLARMTGSPEAAEDAVQETFCRLWERRRSWRVEGSVGGLLFRLARNIAISEHRHLQAEDRAAAVSIENTRAPS